MQAGRAASEEGRAGGPGTGEGLLRGRRHVCLPWEPWLGWKQAQRQAGLWIQM